jgi:hypothetical protein
MNHRNRILPWVLRSVALPALMLAALATAQTRPAPPAKPAATAPTNQDLQRESDAMATTQDQLIKLLRLSPTLTNVVAYDPSLLSNQEYVSRNNPQLAQFLAAHPEIVRNPEFYLFTRLNGQGGRRDQVLQRAVWPEMPQPSDQQYHGRPATEEFISDMPPVLAFACFLGALIWLIRQLSESRRWSRIFKLHLSRSALSRRSVCPMPWLECSPRYRSALCWFCWAWAATSFVLPARIRISPCWSLELSSSCPAWDLSSPQA